MKPTPFLVALIFLLGLGFEADAQMSWSSYNTSGTRVSASAAIFNAATNTYTFTIPANTTYTLAEALQKEAPKNPNVVATCGLSTNATARMRPSR